MTDPICTRSRRILNLGPVEPDAGPVHFVQYDEDGGDDHTLCAIPHPLWVDMGSPDTITLTVEPGDLLNTDNDVDRFARVLSAIRRWETEGTETAEAADLLADLSTAAIKVS